MNTPTKSIMMDTNSVITGILVPWSRSRLIIDRHVTNELRIHVSEDALEEAQGAFERAFETTKVDLWQVFLRAIDHVRLVNLPGVPDAEADLYPVIRGDGDRHILAAAKRHALTIITNDIQDFKRAGEYGVDVLTPMTFTQGWVGDLQNIVTGFLATPESGTFYAVFDAMWAKTQFDPKLDKRFYIFDTELAGSLFYENLSRSIVFEGEYGQRAEVSLPPLGDLERPIHVVVSYDRESGVDLYHGCQGRKSTWEGTWTVDPSKKRFEISVGSNRQVNDHLNGWLLRLASMPQALTHRAANNLMCGNTTSVPWERLSLEKIIEFWYR